MLEVHLSTGAVVRTADDVAMPDLEAGEWWTLVDVDGDVTVVRVSHVVMVRAR